MRSANLRPAILRISASVFALAWLALLAAPRASAGPQSPRDWKPIFDRLDSITSMPLGDWRFHEVDGTHGETPQTDDSVWPTHRTAQEWKTGSAWLRRWVEIPPQLGGYDIRGTRARLRLNFDSDSPARLSVYVNGTLAGEGEELDRVSLGPEAGPGKKILLSIRVQMLPATAVVREASIEFEPAADRPDPRILFEECRAADSLLAAFPAEQAQRGPLWMPLSRPLIGRRSRAAIRPLSILPCARRKRSSSRCAPGCRPSRFMLPETRTLTWPGCGPGRKRWRRFATRFRARSR